MTKGTEEERLMAWTREKGERREDENERGKRKEGELERGQEIERGNEGQRPWKKGVSDSRKISVRVRKRNSG